MVNPLTQRFGNRRVGLSTSTIEQGAALVGLIVNLKLFIARYRDRSLCSVLFVPCPDVFVEFYLFATNFLLNTAFIRDIIFWNHPALSAVCLVGFLFG